MNRFEYKEPEFKVVKTNAVDVLTASNGLLSSISGAWGVGSNGGSGSGTEVDFGL